MTNERDEQIHLPDAPYNEFPWRCVDVEFRGATPETKPAQCALQLAGELAAIARRLPQGTGERIANAAREVIRVITLRDR